MANAGFSYREQVGPAAAGLTVVEYLCRRFSHSAAAVWRERVEAGEVSVDGAPASAATALRSGARVAWRRPPWEEPAVPLQFALLYRDADVLAVAKPAGLPTAPAGGFLEHTLLACVRRSWPEAVPAHRLGRGTSGLVLFARSRAARAPLAAVWREGRVRKVYRALVAGAPAADAFTVDAPIGPVPHPRLGTVHAALASGRAARSHVRVLERRPGGSLVEVTIETGRPHQIRIHLAHAGHPLCGDPLYDEGGTPRAEALPGDGGYLLHAQSLELRHPVTGAPLRLSCLPPPPLRTASGA